MLKQRFFTAIVALAILTVILFVVPTVVARTFIAALLLAGAYEWGGFIFPQAPGRRYWFVVLIGAAMACIFFSLPNAVLVDAIFKIALVWWLAALAWMFFFPTSIPVPVMWACGLLVLVPTWLALDQLYRQAPEMLIFVLLIVWVADIGAYFVGKGFGRVKLAPAISPGKTWEGVLGGLTAVLLLAGAGSRYFEIEIAVLVPFSLAIAMLSVVGDLTVSMFKRTAGVKDSGTLLPGHGGVLDRIDSVTAAAPLFALGLTWIGQA
jgi:phosphatidate cytidylyltransferase